ncbi:vacuolar protein sorting family 37 protein CYBJADRAFT_161475 [Cyberlindnera jadinii NRRL Y-1542]|uniref:VPS37 C-terminal domain-containing protein n=1 Tax=Cyberlindnera jadinii (strain ATCC 18201 / CBS 1600 / BCRC 20928 / JCM 3617 / NBRC 0987 / NRRL Y-1542) TaxID=983966 RepID=A0A1E4S661_CYBJN|nr:hypothetical protein CYBJADRAFT_161475 [Cyberlindnera jadinii NRRL Y-1542]ODV74995.1 hypothetical protein CYBJADRAFT_161475 [Cyberlindnera jadinii NRRL Y-1542]
MSDVPPSLPPKGAPLADNGNSHSRPESSTSPPSQAASHAQTPTPSVKIPLPDNFGSLPTREIEKLLSTLDVLKGYLVTLIQGELDKDVAELEGIVRQIESYKEKLEQLESCKRKTRLKAEEVNELTSQWLQKEQEMKKALYRFSRENLQSLLQTSVQESRKLTESIQATFVSHIDQHDEQSIQMFIKSYRHERKEYYLHKEKLSRFQQGRIGGI